MNIYNALSLSTILKNTLYTETLLTLFDDYKFSLFSKSITLRELIKDPIFLKDFKNKKEILDSYYEYKLDEFIEKINVKVLQLLSKYNYVIILSKKDLEIFDFKNCICDSTLDFKCNKKNLNCKCVVVNPFKNCIRKKIIIKDYYLEKQNILLLRITIRFTINNKKNNFKVIKIDN